MKLNWTIPKKIPHGPLGVGTLAVGSFITSQSLHGNLASDLQIYTFASFAALNAYSGVKLLSKNNQQKPIFDAIANIQYCMSYLCFRFSDNITNCPIEIIDFTASSVMMLSLIRLFQLIQERSFTPAVQSVVLCGLFFMSSFIFYPMQIALYGHSWWNELLLILHDQSNTLASFVYIPSESLISFIMFAATLYDRRMIGNTEIIILTLLIPCLFITTVGIQDLYFSQTATQQVWIGNKLTDPTPIVNNIISFVSNCPLKLLS